jgi:hypothetical protein
LKILFRPLQGFDELCAVLRVDGKLRSLIEL